MSCCCVQRCVRVKQFGNVVQMAGNIFIAKDRQRKLLPNCMRGELNVTPFTSPFILLSQVQYTSCIVLSSHLPFSWDLATSCSGESNTTKYNMEHCSSSPLIVTDCKKSPLAGWLQLATTTLSDPLISPPPSASMWLVPPFGPHLFAASVIHRSSPRVPPFLHLAPVIPPL